jgi:hypothetical protein
MDGRAVFTNDAGNPRVVPWYFFMEPTRGQQHFALNLTSDYSTTELAHERDLQAPFPSASFARNCLHKFGKTDSRRNRQDAANPQSDRVRGVSESEPFLVIIQPDEAWQHAQIFPRPAGGDRGMLLIQ